MFKQHKREKLIEIKIIKVLKQRNLLLKFHKILLFFIFFIKITINKKIP